MIDTQGIMHIWRVTKAGREFGLYGHPEVAVKVALGDYVAIAKQEAIDEMVDNILAEGGATLEIDGVDWHITEYQEEK